MFKTFVKKRHLDHPPKKINSKTTDVFPSGWLIPLEFNETKIAARKNLDQVDHGISRSWWIQSIQDVRSTESKIPL